MIMMDHVKNILTDKTTKILMDNRCVKQVFGSGFTIGKVKRADPFLHRLLSFKLLTSSEWHEPFWCPLFLFLSFFCRKFRTSSPPPPCVPVILLIRTVDLFSPRQSINGNQYNLEDNLIWISNLRLIGEIFIFFC